MRSGSAPCGVVPRPGRRSAAWGGRGRGAHGPGLAGGGGGAKKWGGWGVRGVLGELVGGGVPGEIHAAQATRILDRSTPSGTAGQARFELAAELLADMRRLDAQMRESKKKLAVAVKASATTLTGLFGVGPFVAATVIGDAADVAPFASRDHLAPYNGTAPIEVSSGHREIDP